MGSSNYITNFTGEVSQHMEYFAFGETFIEEHKNSHNAPYKFNGKELDEESGLYYYGARYYDPRISIWVSVDKPLIDGKYLNFEHDGGVLNSFNLNSYAYCRQSPVVLIDPDGNQYNSSVLLTPMKYRSEEVYTQYGMFNKTYEDGHRFTEATAHLLSLVSGVNENNIRNSKITFTSVLTGGGGLTEGASSKESNIHIFHKAFTKKTYSTNTKWFYGFMELMSHEVGHIPQIDEAGGNIQHLAGSFWEYCKNWNYLKDSHDPAYAHKETEAEIGATVFKDFSDFVDKNYGNKGDKKGSKLEKLFNNKSNTQKDIIKRLDQWWKKFQKSK